MTHPTPDEAEVPSRLEQAALFARNFFRHPKMLGSIIPSSPFLIRRLMDQIDWTRTRVVVEYGPGVGSFTREVLRRLPSDGLLVVLETNADFVDFLRRTIPDPRLHVVHGSAAEVVEALAERGAPQADCIISGIPFSTLPPGQPEAILQATREALAPEGVMLVYQFTSSVLPHLQRTFSSVQHSFEPLNVLPAQIYYCAP